MKAHKDDVLALIGERVGPTSSINLVQDSAKPDVVRRHLDLPGSLPT